MLIGVVVPASTSRWVVGRCCRRLGRTQLRAKRRQSSNLRHTSPGRVPPASRHLMGGASPGEAMWMMDLRTVATPAKGPLMAT